MLQKIFTDGSKSNESMSAGTAYISDRYDKIITNSLPKCFSIFSAESVALLNAVEIAIKSPNVNYINNSDGLSSLMCLIKGNLNTKTNSNLYEIKRTPHKISGKRLLAKMYEILICCSSQNSDQKLSRALKNSMYSF